MACGDNGTIIMTNDAGKSWTKMNSNTSLNFTGIYVLNPYLAWAVAYSTKGDSFDIFRFEDKTCLSSFVKVPRDTVICDKYDYLTKFQVKGLNKPTWMVNDALTNLYHINDSTAQIKTVHEGKFIISFELQSCENAVYDTATVYFLAKPYHPCFMIHCTADKWMIIFLLAVLPVLTSGMVTIILTTLSQQAPANIG
jgi:hypothetical protein